MTIGHWIYLWLLTGAVYWAMWMVASERIRAKMTEHGRAQAACAFAMLAACGPFFLAFQISWWLLTLPARVRYWRAERGLKGIAGHPRFCKCDRCRAAIRRVLRLAETERRSSS